MIQKEDTRPSDPNRIFNDIDLDRIVRQNQSNDEIRHLESELRMTLEEIARLQKALTDANMKISALQLPTQTPRYGSSLNREFYLSWGKELEQPLDTVQSYCKLLLSESVGILGSLQRKYIDRISLSVDSMQKMIMEMTDNPQVDRASRQSQMQFFTASELLDPVLNSISESMRAKQVTLGLDIADDLPKLGGDREILEQIIQMLLSNAVLAVEDEGSIQITFQKEMSNGKENILIKVQNSGVGVPQMEIDQLFTYRLQEPEKNIPGMGLQQKDIVLLKMLVEEQYGKIDLISDILQGTVFIVRLPLIETR